MSNIIYDYSELRTNGIIPSAVYANGQQVTRLIANGVDKIHKKSHYVLNFAGKIRLYARVDICDAYEAFPRDSWSSCVDYRVVGAEVSVGIHKVDYLGWTTNGYNVSGDVGYMRYGWTKGPLVTITAFDRSGTAYHVGYVDSLIRNGIVWRSTRSIPGDHNNVARVEVVARLQANHGWSATGVFGDAAYTDFTYEVAPTFVFTSSGVYDVTLAGPTHTYTKDVQEY